nr:hypothetical protein RSP673_21940 [Ralstonia solanacearum P673]
MPFAQLLSRQRRAEVGVAIADQSSNMGLQSRRQLVVARLALMPVLQACRALSLITLQ